MSLVKFGALGGLGENGKNLYIVVVDEKIFILDCGIKYPSVDLFGVDTIIPNFDFLLANKNKIQGIFLSHGHEDHIGGLVYLLKDFNVPIYGSDFTIALVSDLLKDKGYILEKYKIIKINEKALLNFKGVSVSFFNTTHSIPESLGIVIHTKNGCIVYTGDYSFDQNVDRKYRTSFDKLSEIAKEGVLCLIGESIGANTSSGNSYFELMHKINTIFTKAPGRIIVSLFSTDLRRIQQIINMSLRFNKRIAIIGRRTQRIVDIAVKLGYLVIPENKLVSLRYLEDKNLNNDPDLVVLVTGDRHEPFFMLQRMSKGIDRLIKMEKNDTIISMTAPVPGTEKMASKTLDILYRNLDKIFIIENKIMQSSHATREEIKMMINILNPKYIFPIKGEYRLQVAQVDIAKEIGYDPKNVILLQNGNFFGIEKGIGKGIISTFNASEVLIDGAVDSNINNVVIRDRELLSNNGILLIVANINPKNKTIVSGPEIITKGFVYIKESEDILNGIKNIFNNISDKQMKNKYINWSEYKKALRDDINRYLYKEIRRTPITIPVIISTDYIRKDL